MPQVAPGTYTVRLSVAGVELTSTLLVNKDPARAGGVNRE